MRVTILSIGSRGDLQPFIALAMALEKKGHEVVIATHCIFEDLVRSYGLQFFRISGNTREALDSEAGRASVSSGSNTFRSWRNFVKLISPIIYEMGVDCYNASQDSDAIIYSPLGFYWGPHVSEKLQIPSIGVYLSPIHSTAEFPSYLIVTAKDLGSVVNRFSWSLSHYFSWLPFRSNINRFRTEFLNLPPISKLNYNGYLKMQDLILYGISPSVFKKPGDWVGNIEVTGYWFLDDFNWTPPPDLINFLENGSKPIYVGFGSMAAKGAERMTNVILESIGNTGQRAVFASGWGGIRRAEISENIYVTDYIPHDWIFPKVKAVIHHGGAGTTAAGFRAGVPSIIVPFFLDQYFWGYKVNDMGLGPKPIPQTKLSVNRLTDAIENTLNSEEIITNSKNMGYRLQSEDGISKAIKLIEDYL